MLSTCFSPWRRQISYSLWRRQLLLDSRLLLTTTSKRPKRSIDDITSWSEAFSIYSLILTSHYPSRWHDLTLYKPLILRTYHQFQGNAWLTYDRAFREHAAAARLTDWSSINAPSSLCRFAHRCSICSSNHRASECPSARNRLQPDHQAPRRPSIKNVIRRHVHLMPIPYIVLYFVTLGSAFALTCFPAWDSLV